MEPQFDELCYFAAELGCFSIMLREFAPYKDEWDSSLPLHENVLLPLIADSLECRLFGPLTEPRLVECVESRWKPSQRNTFVLAEKSDPIRGQETFGTEVAAFGGRS